MRILLRSLLILPTLWATPAEALLWRLGAVSTDSLKIFSTTGDTQKTITVNVAGVGAFTVNESVWTDTLDGSPENTYYAVIEITGLQPWTTYSYSIFADSVKEGDGSFRTLPDNQTTPFELALVGCDTPRTDGLYDEIVSRSSLNGGSLVAVVHVDDIGYLDNTTVTNVEGVTSTGRPAITKLSYDYAAAWVWELNHSSDGRDWINHNVPTFWMWGDHEVQNDFMTHRAAISEFGTGTREAGEHVTLDNRLWIAANTAYSKMAEAVVTSFDSPNPVNGTDGKTYAYGFDAGPVRFFLHDRNSAGECSNCTPDVECTGKICGEITGHQPYLENFGKTQLDHLKSWLDDASHPFKILFSGITIGGHSVVDNQPWLSWWPSEYYDFEAWLDNSPNLNGTDGNFLFVAGDRHNFSVHKRQKAPPNNGGADFIEYYVGTITGSPNHDPVPVGEILNGCEVVYSESAVLTNRDHWLTILGVSQTELKLTTYDRNHEEIFNGTLRHRAGNLFVDMTGGLDVLDVVTPSSPVPVAATGIHGNRLDVAPTAAYLAADWRGINVVDISNPASPTTVSSITGVFAESVTVFGTDLYIASGWNGLRILDGSNPLAPVTVASKATIDNRYAVDISIDNQSQAYIAASGSPGLQVFNVSNPNTPEPVGWLELYEVNGVAIKGDYVYVASGTQGLKIISKAQPSVTNYIAQNTASFDIPTHLPDGTYDITVVNLDGTTFKATNSLNIIRDSDGDGLSDVDEVNIYMTDPLDPDSDDDGLTDGDEVYLYVTNPNDNDTDNDGARDGLEVAVGTDPLNPGSFPITPDGDITGDGVVDLTDVLLGKRILLNQITPTTYQAIHGDVAPLVGGIPTPNGNINVGDILLIERKALGLVLF